ncbi:MAG TPA: O-antigen ligase family protein, partial [Bacteroidales bacterium]|nr:O-antigen ligase family protein [Bacteroidales bacterium]
MTEVLAKYRSLIIIWVISLFFVALNGILIYKEVFYLPLLPFVLFFMLVAFTALDRLILMIVFFVPLSIPLSYLVQGLPFDLYLPTEPLLAGAMLLFFIKYLRGEKADIRILRHPVTMAIYFNLAWMFMTTLTSTDILVSAKYLLARIWFVISFYLLAAMIFRERKNMRRYVWLYIVSFSLVVAYTLIRHSAYGLNNQMMAHSMMQPFYKDHTSYGATLAMLLPVLIALLSNVKKEAVNARFLMILLIIFYTFATVFSYTRAAWLSLAIGLGIWVLIKLKIRFMFVLISAAALIALFLTFETQIMLNIEKNRQQSSGKFTEHVESMSNVSTDQSNLERINRWSCAIRMFEERPVFGFGPGTYQFEYARFQRSYEKTQISTDFGNRGTAHSEYLGPLSESGLLGMLSIIFVIVSIILTGIRV